MNDAGGNKLGPVTFDNKGLPAHYGYQPTAKTTDGPTGEPPPEGSLNLKKLQPPKMESAIQPPKAAKPENK